ncbi:response regulator transcription factor [Heliophilum fasciatum]|uniref:Stage 0 sporulation protein A homolog n=1 Tax=Heliophilum fasciatum TaxID=35700 RepID=A0A4R2RW40_9FIRM|nr:response regulator transcription factor [Heliophilum fasciatum]MCW2276890.1 DNA-binding response OmpR family regulator [Heliophilum fasciatum]TCP68650.1 DNA-binding response OmpR family regulator [Heliophilum fasciatum]
MALTILVVDDEQKILDMVTRFLTSEGYNVKQALDGPAALETIHHSPPDLVLLDWMLPGKSGIDVCKEIRAHSLIPIIMLTARVDESEKVLGLEMGADDYITKPFGLRELAARIRSVMRRYEKHSEITAPVNPSILRRGALSIDTEKFEASLQDQPLNLTATEFKILHTLAQRPGVVYSRLQLMRLVMGEAYLNYERSIDTHVSNLRKKIGDTQGEQKYILTVFGVGYKFAERY